jgi:hypothetical protein
MKNMIFIFVTLILLFLGYFILYKRPQQLVQTNAIIGNTKIYVEIADNSIKITKGLSGRKKLEDNSGMLFLFSSAHKPKFWMMGMNFGLDFIWINNGKVVDIHENITPENLPPPNTISPKEDVDMVLEINSGFIKNNKITVGNNFQLLD